MDKEQEEIFRDIAEGAERRKQIDPRLAAAEKQLDEATMLLIKKHSEKPDQETKLETGWILKTNPVSDDQTSMSDDGAKEKPSYDKPDHNGLS